MLTYLREECSLTATWIAEEKDADCCAFLGVHEEHRFGSWK